MELVMAGVVVRGDLSPEQIDWITRRLEDELRAEAGFIAVVLGSEFDVRFQGFPLGRDVAHTAGG